MSDKSIINWAKIFSMDGMRNDEGRPNLEAAMEYLKDNAREFVSQEIDPDRIDEVLNGIFDGLKETKQQDNPAIDIDSLVNRAIQELDAPLGDEKRFSDQVKKFIRGESKRFEDTMGEQGRFVIRRGPGLGTQRSSPSVIAAYKAARTK